ncbi:Aromatic ring-opening dioxygenase, LigB subunit [Bacillus sp. OV322]|uniref:DODA-type extradiol aromatic ring-opening family dioxygenase n=1 Tax=Bacillus sp. OV322 TaxID=1882764 RepID=UPI0008F186B0|nr:extradiol ring-cleavage dioxygenase [Bacillus sp. OV322]SFC71866.1 Aromatic ring-opening dioxygenase, LigB subunit [Bacillus sp. OV322]
MNPFVFACITPHGGEIIPELKGDFPGRMSVTRSSLYTLGKEMAQAMPDSLIVLTPHGTRINGVFSISDSEYMEGVVEENGSSFSMKITVDRDLAKNAAKKAEEAGIKAGTINFGTSAGPFSCLQLDWGAIVPLRFMPEVPAVIITPSRELAFKDHLEFGRVLKMAALASEKKIGIIASCDWSHTHQMSGPYGFHEDAAKLDGEVKSLLEKKKLEEMQDFSTELIDNAKPDGIWQTLILAGAIPSNEREVKVLSYEAPTYFGLISAAIYPK